MRPNEPEAERVVCLQVLEHLREYEVLLRALRAGQLDLPRHEAYVKCIDLLAGHAASVPALSGACIRFFLGHLSLLQAWRHSGFDQPPDELLQQACDEQLDLVVLLRRAAMRHASR